MKNESEVAAFRALLEEAGAGQMGHALYAKIAYAFTRNSKHVSVNMLSSLLKLFVGATVPEPIYVNEIKDFLKIHNTRLYNRYASLFSFNIGSEAVFGIVPDKDAGCPVLDEALEEHRQAEEAEERPLKTEKSYRKVNRKKHKNTIRKNARQAAEEEQRRRIVRKRENRTKREEFKALVRKENNN